MGILNIFKRSKKPPIKFANFSYGSYMDAQIGSDSTSFSCIDMICNSFASLGFDFYNRYTREKADHSLKELLLDPNSEMTRFDFFYNSAKNLFIHGNCYWYKYDIDNEIVSLFLLNPNEVRVQRDSVTNEKLFYYNGGIYRSDKILHIPSRYGFNGLIGQGILNVCNSIFKNAAEMDLYVRNSFNQNVQDRLVIDLSANPDLTKEQLENYKQEFIRGYAGVKNSGVPLIKRKGVNFESIKSGVQSNEAQQLDQNRKFNEREVSKLFHVPLEMLSGESKGRDLETIYTEYLDQAIRPLAAQFEEHINKNLLSANERQAVYFEFNYNNLSKTSLQTRIDTYTKQLTNGILTVNEVRRKENLPLVEAGDSLFIPANLMPLREDVIDSYMAGAKLKENELLESNSKEYHESTPKKIGDDKL